MAGVKKPATPLASPDYSRAPPPALPSKLRSAARRARVCSAHDRDSAALGIASLAAWHRAHRLQRLLHAGGAWPLELLPGGDGADDAERNGGKDGERLVVLWQQKSRH